MKRKNGFYWVKLCGVWCVSEYIGTHWYIAGNEIAFNDEEFNSIIEKRLLPFNEEGK